MKIAVVQFDDRPLEALAHLGPLIHQNARYAARHGYEYTLVTRHGMDIPPFWAKTQIVLFYLRSGYDAVLWLDTDAVVHDLSIPFTRFFSEDAAFVFSPDNPVWRSPFNAGVFMCKGPHALKIMEEWAALYNPSQWEKVGQEWRCRDPRWAGPEYEQGSFAIHLLPKYAESGLLKILGWDILQSPFPLQNAFTLHFAGYFKTNIAVYTARPPEEERPLPQHASTDHAEAFLAQQAHPVHMENRTEN
jgi:hypothetical protein